MLFITLVKDRGKATKEMLAKADKLLAKAAEEGVRIKGFYWTLGRFDNVIIAEAKDEKTVMKALLRGSDLASFETLVAIPREEARKLLD